MAKRCGNGVWVERRARDLWQERVKDHVVLAIEEDDLARLSRQLPSQRPRALHAAEPATDDHDAFGSTHHARGLFEEPCHGGNQRLFE